MLARDDTIDVKTLADRAFMSESTTARCLEAWRAVIAALIEVGRLSDPAAQNKEGGGRNLNLQLTRGDGDDVSDAARGRAARDCGSNLVHRHVDAKRAGLRVGFSWASFASKMPAVSRATGAGRVGRVGARSCRGGRRNARQM